MGHNHSHDHSHTENITTAFFLNLIFVVVEIIGGLLTNSIAILSDALHDFGDCLSLATAWFLQKKSTKSRDKKYSYGYKRFSLLGAIFLSGILSLSSVIVIVESIKRIINPQVVNEQGMILISIFGIVINGIAALKVKRGSSLNERAVYIHIIEDVLGWVCVLIVGIVMLFIELPILDPILSISLSVWVLVNVYRNIRSVFKVLLQSVPDTVSIDTVIERLNEINGVVSIHDLHIWSLDGESHVMTIHIVTSKSDNTQIKQEIVEIVKKFNITHTTIEFESPNYICTTSCD